MYSFNIAFAKELKLRDNLFKFLRLSIALSINCNTDMRTCYIDMSACVIVMAILTKTQIGSKSSNV